MQFVLLPLLEGAVGNTVCQTCRRAEWRSACDVSFHRIDLGEKLASLLGRAQKCFCVLADALGPGTNCAAETVQVILEDLKRHASFVRGHSESDVGSISQIVHVRNVSVYVLGISDNIMFYLEFPHKWFQ